MISRKIWMIEKSWNFHTVFSPLGLFYYSNVREIWAYSFWTHQLKAFQCQVLNSAMTELQNGKMVFTFSKMNGTEKEKKELFCWVIVMSLFCSEHLSYITFPNTYRPGKPSKLGIQDFSAFQILREIDFGILKPQK